MTASLSLLKIFIHHIAIAKHTGSNANTGFVKNLIKKENYNHILLNCFSLAVLFCVRCVCHIFFMKILNTEYNMNTSACTNKSTIGGTDLIFLDRFVDVLVSLQGKSALIHLFAQHANILEEIVAVISNLAEKTKALLQTFFNIEPNYKRITAIS